MPVAFLLMLVAYLAGNGYIYFRAVQFLVGLPLWGRILFTLCYWLCAFAMLIALLTRNMEMPLSISQLLYKTGSTWLVFTLYMVLALLAVDLLRCFFPLGKYGFFLALGATVLLLSHGYSNYCRPKINRFSLSLNKSSLADSMKIVAVSDVHLGYGTGKSRLKKYVEMINAEKPDLILIAGDLIDNSLLPLNEQRMHEELSMLQAPMGIYMVPGNHEHISGMEEAVRFLAKTPIRLLRDTVVVLPNGVQLVGRDDRANRRRLPLKRLMEKVDHTRPIVMLDHQPYEVARKDSMGVDLQISGHTHHGQIWPISLLTDRIFEQSHGFRRWNHSHVYVSSGLSLWGPPFRIGTESDMAVFVLK